MRRGLPGAPASLHASPLVRGPAPAPVAATAAHRALRRGAQSHEPARGLSLSSPLPAGPAAVPERGADLAGGQARPADRLPFVLMGGATRTPHAPLSPSRSPYAPLPSSA